MLVNRSIPWSKRVRLSQRAPVSQRAPSSQRLLRRRVARSAELGSGPCWEMRLDGGASARYNGRTPLLITLN